MRRIAIMNHKGGVGKTTTAVNLGAGLNLLGKRVLLIDMDSQAHLTYSFGLNPETIVKTVYDLMKGEAEFSDVMSTRDGIDIIPSYIDLSGRAGRELRKVKGWEFMLKRALDGVEGYDYILFDCPPHLGLYTLNALTAAAEIFIILEAEYLALQGMTKLLKWIDLVRDKYNKEIEITGIVVTHYDKRRTLNREVINMVNRYFKGKLFNTQIRENVSLAEAPSHGKSIFKYMPKSHGAEDYLNLSREVIDRREQYGQEREAGS